MNIKQVDSFETRTETIATQSDAVGMFYFTAADDCRIAIGADGICILTPKQARQLLTELPDMIEMYCVKK